MTLRARCRWPVLLAACLALTGVAGCAASVSGSPLSGGAPSSQAPPSASSSSSSSSPPGVNVAAFDALASREAAAWARSPLAVQWRSALVVFTADELTSGPSAGFPSGADKMAFLNGDLVFTGRPPAGAPAGVVTWPDGSTLKVPIISAAQALAKLTSSKACPGCATTSLAITAIRPATLALGTSRGRATVPAWAFTLQGVSTPVLEAALPSGSYVTPGSQGAPTARELARLGTGFTGTAGATVAGDGRTLTLRVPGSPCDTTWGGVVDEAGGAVVVGGWMHNPHPDGACPASLVLRTATVTLAAPLAGRVILDASTGQPVRQG